MTKTICSIYYEPLKAERAIYGGKWAVPAVKKGDKPFMLSINDHVQLEDVPYFRGTVGGKQKKEPRLIVGEEIAEDLLKEWARNHPDMTPNCCPGIFVVRDVIPMFADEKGTLLLDALGKQIFRPATDTEKAQMFEEDMAAAKLSMAAWGQLAIQRGDIMAEDPKKVAWIPDYCKASARYYGRDRKWLHELTDGDIKNCVFCTKVIAVNAVKCPHCNEVVDRKRYEELTARAPIAPPLNPNEKKQHAA